MPQVSVHGVDVFYRDEGSGPTVILGHSSTASGGQWRSLIGRLSNRYRLLAPDHLGYGRTGPWPGELPLIEHEKAIIAALIDLVPNPVHLVGHSFGGAIMARVGADAPERVRSLTMIEPTLFHLLAPAGKLRNMRKFERLRIEPFSLRTLGTLRRRPAGSSGTGLDPAHTTRWSPAFVSQ
jgi:pimeloyl-ACP methyl ester carboxylesterase